MNWLTKLFKRTGEKRYPKVGETWTFQSCIAHGCPSSYPYDWKKFPVAQSFDVTDIKDFYKDLVDCGCMQYGCKSPVLHGGG